LLPFAGDDLDHVEVDAEAHLEQVLSHLYPVRGVYSLLLQLLLQILLLGYHVGRR
jgi:hypothetical protein